MKNGIRFLIGIMVVCFFAGISAGIYFLTDGLKKDVAVKPFVVIRNDEYILSDTKGLSFSGKETFFVKHYVEDDEISVQLKPIELKEDYTFEIDGKIYSWNSDVVRYASIFITGFTLAIDQELNEVTVEGSLLSGIKAYAKQADLLGKVFLDNIPKADMFRLSITTAGSKIDLDFRFTS